MPETVLVIVALTSHRILKSRQHLAPFQPIPSHMFVTQLLDTRLRNRIEQLSLMVCFHEMPFAIRLNRSRHQFCFQKHGLTP